MNIHKIDHSDFLTLLRDDLPYRIEVRIADYQSRKIAITVKRQSDSQEIGPWSGLISEIKIEDDVLLLPASEKKIHLKIGAEEAKEALEIIKVWVADKHSGGVP